MSHEQALLNRNFSVILEPYKHFFENSEISSDSLNNILDWLENCNHWERTVEDFYSQYEFSIKSVELPSSISFLVSDTFLNHLIEVVGDAFSTKLADKVDVVAHKLVSNDIIRIHNDFIQDKETHRVLLHLNRNWTEECGGYFMMFANQNPESVVKVLPPHNGHVCGFEISKKSFHAVSKVHEGERYSVIYSFYGG